MAACGQTEVERSYYSLNPGMFSCEDSWSYRDLQGLCKSLGVSGKGKRASLVRRLEQLHLSGREGTIHGAGRFHEEEVAIDEADTPVSPRLLSPLTLNHQVSGPILRRESSMSNIVGGHTPTPLRKRRQSSLRFSPYNRVKVIPPKEETENFGQYREPDWASICWDEDEDEGEESRCTFACCRSCSRRGPLPASAACLSRLRTVPGTGSEKLLNVTSSSTLPASPLSFMRVYSWPIPGAESMSSECPR